MRSVTTVVVSAAVAVGLMFVLVNHQKTHAAELSTDDFVTTWKTDNSGTSNSSSINIPAYGSGYNYNVDWDNDGVFDELGLTGGVTHDFGVPGVHTIRISGTFPKITYQYSDNDIDKLLSVDQWGAGKWLTMKNAFHNASNMTITATDMPDLSLVTDMSSMFSYATSFNIDISNWDVSNVTNMNSMFYGAELFNQNLTDWDVSNVTDMGTMFHEAKTFNADLSTWNVSKVTNMHQMFKGALVFNSDISDWDVSSVTDMDGMFSYGSEFVPVVFNGDISRWDVSKVTNMSSMFYSAINFNQDISRWNVSQVTNMSSMFSGARSFNQSLSGWDVSKVANISNMFYGATSFNQPVSNWDLSGAVNMAYMFGGATRFNQDISRWNVSNVTNMSGLFYNATDFNQDISNWDVSSLVNMTFIFSNATSFNTDISRWNVSNATNMNGLFSGARVFSQDLSSWNVSKVTNMSRMFESAGMSPIQSDRTIRGWATKPLQSDIAISISYCTTEPEREYLRVTFNWTITGYQGCDLLVGSTYIGNSYVMNFVGLASGGQSLGILSIKPDSAGPSSHTLACGTPGADNALFTIGGVSGRELIPKVDLAYANPLDKNGDNEYELCVRSFDVDGFWFDRAFKVRITPQPDIENVTFEHVSEGLIMNVKGTGLIETPDHFALALQYSLVNLNGVNLSFCAQGFGMTAQELTDTYAGFGYELEGLVTDDVPCYFLTRDGMNIDLTPTQALILLPDTFDSTAQGTVSVNGSPTYTFNAVDNGEGEGSIPPTAHANGSKPLDQNPTLPKLPTFSGVATPHSTVIVTVHSDPVTCTTTADATGNWSCTLPTTLPAGSHTVFIQVTNPDNSVVELGPYAVTVAESGGGGVIDSSTPLAPNTGFLTHHAAILQQYQAQKTSAVLPMYAVGGAAAALLAGGVAYGITQMRRRHQ